MGKSSWARQADRAGRPGYIWSSASSGDQPDRNSETGPIRFATGAVPAGGAAAAGSQRLLPCAANDMTPSPRQAGRVSGRAPSKAGSSSGSRGPNGQASGVSRVSNRNRGKRRRPSVAARLSSPWSLTGPRHRGSMCLEGAADDPVRRPPVVGRTGCPPVPSQQSVPAWEAATEPYPRRTRTPTHHPPDTIPSGPDRPLTSSADATPPAWNPAVTASAAGARGVRLGRSLPRSRPPAGPGWHRSAARAPPQPFSRATPSLDQILPERRTARPPPGRATRRRGASEATRGPSPQLLDA